MTDRLAAVELRTLAPRATLRGFGDSLENISTNKLPNGAQCFVLENSTSYRLDKSSAAAPTLPSIVRPAAGPGRWISAATASSGVDVREFGASPSASAAENTTAVQAADAAALLVGEELFFPPDGAYALNTITIASPIRPAVGARLQAAVGQTVTIGGEVLAEPTQWVFDSTVGGHTSFVLTEGVVAEIYPAQFGVVGDADEATGAGSDNWPALWAMREATRQWGRAVIRFLPGTYAWSRGFWCKGYRELVIEATGCTFFNSETNPAVNGDALTLDTNRGTFVDFGYNDDTAVGHSNTQSGSKFATASAGDTTITTLTAGDAGEFTEGDNVIIYGYTQQTQSAPPNMRYFEYHKVVSADGGTGDIDIDFPLQYDYDAGWLDAGDGDAGQGAPRVLNLNRTNFDFGEHITIRGARFVPNVLWVSGPGLNGRLVAQGYRHVYLEDVEATAKMVPSSCESVLCQRCKFGEVELDKLVGAVTFKDCIIGLVGQGFAVTYAEFVGGRIEGFQDIAARNMTFHGVEFHNPNGTSPFQVLDLASAAHIEALRVHDCRFGIEGLNLSVGDTGLIAGGVTQTLTVNAVPSPDTISVRVASDSVAAILQRWLAYKKVLRGQSVDKTCRITRIFSIDATHIGIQGDWSAVPVVAEVYQAGTVQHLEIENAVQIAGTLVQKAVSFPEQENLRLNARARFGSITLGLDDLWRPASGQPFSDFKLRLNAALVRVWCEIVQAYTGASGSPGLRIQSLEPAGGTLITIDPLTTGAREVTRFGVQGSVGTDSLGLNLPTTVFRQIGIRLNQAGNYPLYASYAELPQFVLHIEYSRPR